jgi:hypothetical protein
LEGSRREGGRVGGTGGFGDRGGCCGERDGGERAWPNFYTRDCDGTLKKRSVAKRQQSIPPDLTAATKVMARRFKKSTEFIEI